MPAKDERGGNSRADELFETGLINGLILRHNSIAGCLDRHACSEPPINNQIPNGQHSYNLSRGLGTVVLAASKQDSFRA
ncbi:hypothetical protein WJX79_001822 [Trebouxia sp. C0005]